MSGIKIDKKDLWIWWERIQAYEKSGMPPAEFCKKHGYPIKTFYNRYNRMMYKATTHPALYQKLVPIVRQYLSGEMSKSEFTKVADISMSHLTEMVTHLNYVDLIEELKLENGIAPMKFVQVPAVQPRISEVEAEVMKKQNDVELMISSGIKVVVAPEVGADKLIRIIELLKDL